MYSKMGSSTQLCHDSQPETDVFGAVVPPIYQSSLFTFPSWEAIELAFDDKIGNAIYSRGRNPTVVEAEVKLARIAGAEKARLFASGMAAISAGVMHFLTPNSHLVCIRNAYGPAINLVDNYLTEKMAISVSFVNGDVNEIAAALQDNTKLIYLESPSSGLFSLQDLSAIACLAKERGVATMIDNTWATPLFQNPLALGIDLEMHSCSKYLGGHSDIISGVLMGRAELIDAIHRQEYELLGAKMAPIEAWFLLRSLRTLPLRMAQHQRNGLAVAHFLNAHPKVAKVRYPGLETHPQHLLAKTQMRGVSGLMGFQLATDDLNAIKAFVNGLRLFHIGVSWGGHESLIYAPAIGYLKELTPQQFDAMGISIADMRISVGLEDAMDLIADLAQAFELVP